MHGTSMLAVVALYVVAVQDLTCPEGQFAERDECVRCQPGKYRQDQTEVVTCLIRMDPETVIVNNGVQHANTLVQHTAVTDNLPDYAWGTLGAPECPMNYHPIFTETKCKLAAAALKFEEPEGPVLSFLQPAQNAWSSSTVNFVQSDIQVAENSGKGALGCVHNATQQNVILNDAQNGRMKHQHDVLLCGKMRAFEAKFEPAVDANLIVEVQHVGNTQSYCGAASVIVSCTSSIVESAYNTFAASPDTCNTVYAMCKSGRGWWAGNKEKSTMLTCSPSAPYTESTRKCAYCRGGQYQDQEAQLECKGELCTAGKFAPPIPYTEPFNCTDCPSGQYTSVSGSTVCSGAACAQGTYYSNSQVQEHVCTPCEKGKYQHEVGKTSCLDCPTGLFQDQSGAPQCKAPPTKCGANLYWDHTDNKIQCKQCVNPSCCSEQSGSLLCTSCPNGKWSMREDASNYCHGQHWDSTCTQDEYVPDVPTTAPVFKASNAPCQTRLDSVSSAEWINPQLKNRTVMASESSVASFVSFSGLCSGKNPLITRVPVTDGLLTVEKCAKAIRTIPNVGTMIHVPAGTSTHKAYAYTESEAFKRTSATTPDVCCRLCKLELGCRAWTHVTQSLACHLFLFTPSIDYGTQATSGDTEGCAISTGTGECYSSQSHILSYDEKIALLDPESVACETETFDGHKYCMPETITIMTDHHIDKIKADSIAELKPNEPFYADNCLKVQISNNQAVAGTYDRRPGLLEYCDNIKGCSQKLKYADAGLQQGFKTLQAGDADARYNECLGACQQGKCFTVHFFTHSASSTGTLQVDIDNMQGGASIPQKCFTPVSAQATYDTKTASCAVVLCDTNNVRLRARSSKLWSFSMTANGVMVWDGRIDTYGGISTLRKVFTTTGESYANCLGETSIFVSQASGTCNEADIRIPTKIQGAMSTNCYSVSVTGTTCTYSYRVPYMDTIGWHVSGGSAQAALGLVSNKWIVANSDASTKSFAATCLLYKFQKSSFIPTPRAKSATQASTACEQFVEDSQVYTRVRNSELYGCKDAVYCVDESSILCKCRSPAKLDALCTLYQNNDLLHAVQFSKRSSEIFAFSIDGYVRKDHLQVQQNNNANCFSVLSPKDVFEQSPMWSQSKHDSLWVTTQTPKKLFTKAFLPNGIQMHVKVQRDGYLLTYDQEHKHVFELCPIDTQMQQLQPTEHQCGPYRNCAPPHVCMQEIMPAGHPYFPEGYSWCFCAEPHGAQLQAAIWHANSPATNNTGACGQTYTGGIPMSACSYCRNNPSEFFMPKYHDVNPPSPAPAQTPAPTPVCQSFMTSSLATNPGEYILDAEGNLLFSDRAPNNEHIPEPETQLTTSVDFLRMCPAPEQLCLSCTDGFICNGLTRVTCSIGTEASNGSCEQCPAGKKGVLDPVTEGAMCENCAAGKFQDEVGQLQCKNCATGQYQDNIGHTNCTLCAQGQFGDTVGLLSCTTCAVGHFANTRGTTTCLACALGQFTDLVGQTACKLCLPGRHQNLQGQTACYGNLCPVGTFASLGQIAPVQCKYCAAGKFQDEQGQTQCKTCTDGRISTAGQSECTPCDLHFYKLTHTQCQECPLGKFSLRTGTTTCEACPSGKYGVSDGTRCAFCPAGEYSMPQSVSCLPCPDGATRPRSETLGFCDGCPAGMYKFSNTICSLCPAGKYSFGGTNSCSDVQNTDCAVRNQQQKRGATNDTIEAVCIGCGAGRYGDNGTCALCPAGKFNDEANINCTSELSCCEPVFCPPATVAQQPGATSPLEACEKCPKGSRPLGNSSCVEYAGNVTVQQYVADQYPCWSPLMPLLSPSTQTVMLCPCNGFGEAMLGPDNGVSFIDKMSRHFFPGQPHMHGLTFGNVFAFKQSFAGCQNDTFDYTLTSVTTEPQIQFNVEPFCDMFDAIKPGKTVRNGYEIINGPMAVIEAQDDAMCWSVLTNYIRAEQKRRVQRLTPAASIQSPATKGAFGPNECTSPPCMRIIRPFLKSAPQTSSQPMDVLHDSKKCIAQGGGTLECLQNCAKYMGFDNHNICVLLKVSDECPERTKLCFVAKAGSQKQVVNADVWPEDNFKCKHHTLESEVRSICAAEPKCTAYAISQYSACYVLRNDTDAVSSQLELPYDKLYSKRSALHTVGMRIQTEHIEGGTAVTTTNTNVECLRACNSNPQCTAWQFEPDFNRCLHTFATASRVRSAPPTDATCCTKKLKDRVIKLWTSQTSQLDKKTQTGSLQDYADSIEALIGKSDNADSIDFARLDWDNHKCCNTDAKKSSQFCRLLKGKPTIALNPDAKCPVDKPARCIDALEITTNKIDMRMDGILASQLPSGCGATTETSTSAELVPIVSDDEIYMSKYADAHIHHSPEDIMTSADVVTFEACGDLCAQNVNCTALMFNRAGPSCVLLSTAGANAAVDTYTPGENSFERFTALGTDVGVKATFENGDRIMKRYDETIGTHATEFDTGIPFSWTMELGNRPVTYCMRTCMAFPWCTGFVNSGAACSFYKGTKRGIGTSSPNFYHMLRITTRTTCSTDIVTKFGEQRYLMARKDTDWFTIDDQNFVPGDAVTATSAYKWFDLQQCIFVSPDF